MSALLASVAAATVVFTLLVAFAEHLSTPAALPRALADHRVLPAPSVVAAVVVAAEGLLGGAGAVALVRGSGDLLAVALVGSTVLLAGYGGYGLHVRSTRHGGSCGCSRVALPMTGWVVARAFLLAGAALLASVLVGVVLHGSVGAVGQPGAPRTVALLAAATFTCLLWHLPAALHEPSGGPTPARQPLSDSGGGGA